MSISIGSDVSDYNVLLNRAAPSVLRRSFMGARTVRVPRPSLRIGARPQSGAAKETRPARPAILTKTLNSCPVVGVLWPQMNRWRWPTGANDQMSSDRSQVGAHNQCLCEARSAGQFYKIFATVWKGIRILRPARSRHSPLDKTPQGATHDATYHVRRQSHCARAVTEQRGRLCFRRKTTSS